MLTSVRHSFCYLSNTAANIKNTLLRRKTGNPYFFAFILLLNDQLNKSSHSTKSIARKSSSSSAPL